MSFGGDACAAVGLSGFLGIACADVNPFVCLNGFYCPHGPIVVGGYPNGTRALLCPETGKLGGQLKIRDGYWLTRRGAPILHYQDRRKQLLRDWIYDHRKERYRLYLQSKWWQAKREPIIARCNGCCEECRHSPVEAIHHLNYYHIYHEELEDLTGLCSLCHKRAHGLS